MTGTDPMRLAMLDEMEQRERERLSALSQCIGCGRSMNGAEWDLLRHAQAMHAALRMIRHIVTAEGRGDKVPADPILRALEHPYRFPLPESPATTADQIRRIADEDIGGNAPWLADELHELARAVEVDMSGPAEPIPRRWSFTRDDLTDVISHLEASIPASGPMAGKIDAGSMAAAIIEGLERRQHARETCHFWDIRAKVCRYETLFLGCEPCAACPGPDQSEPSGPIFIHSEPGQPDICGNCGIRAGEHGAKCGEYRERPDDVGWFPDGDPADDSYIGGYRPGVEGD